MNGGQYRNEDSLMPGLKAAPTGPQGYHGRYEGTRESARRARHDVEMILSTWHMDALRPSAAQVVAELMANAVSHCGSKPVTMEMTRTPEGVRITVEDSCRKEPTPREAAPTDENGRGMLLIAAFATTWGWENVRSIRSGRSVGKRVWADLVM